MTDARLLVLDAGTTSTRAMLYTPDGTRMATAQRNLGQHYPRPGWVEQDPIEIWAQSLACARDMVAQAGGADRIAAPEHVGPGTLLFGNQSIQQPRAFRLLGVRNKLHLNAGLPLKIFGNRPGKHIVNRSVDDDSFLLICTRGDAPG